MMDQIGNRVKTEESRRLAAHVQASMFRNSRELNSQVRNWGVKTAPFVVLVGAEAPGILSEIGVISNSDEERKLRTPEYREQLAMFLEEGIVTYLNEKGLKARGAARGQVYGTDQRDTAIYASTVDLDEAYKVGQKAALIAQDGENGYMATILRRPGMIYNVDYDKVPLEKVANSERTFPDQWITENRIDVTDEFLA